MEEKYCKYCKRKFTPKYRSSQNYCSGTCQVKEWVSKNKDHLKKYKRNWRLKNLGKTITQGRIYQQNNREKVKVWTKKHFLKNKNKIYEDNKKYRLNNPEKIKANNKARYFVSLKPTCEICGSVNDLQRHHWRYDKPLIVNTLCRSCHSIQHIKHFQGVIA